MTQQPPAPQPHSMIGGFASKLQSGIGLATAEMPLAGDLLSLIAKMFEAFHTHTTSGQQ